MEKVCSPNRPKTGESDRDCTPLSNYYSLASIIRLLEAHFKDLHPHPYFLPHLVIDLTKVAKLILEFSTYVCITVSYFKEGTVKEPY